ncbi:S8 family peptidase [Bacillus sp. BR_7]|uniref:S8 family peptidase n=1 Tax=Bacillus sp. BR_7 TaxID=3055774 RepID=UPI0035C0D3CD
MFIKKVCSISIICLFFLCSCFSSNSKPASKKEKSDEAKITKQKNWGFKAIYSDETKINDYKSLPKVKVAILDSGINKNHQDLKGKIVKDYNAINPGNENVDNYGHGTAVAGIIAAHDDDLGLTGISPNAEIYDVKVLDDKGLADIDTLIKGIQWCIQENVQIMNISFGVQSDNPKLKEAIDEALDKGIIIVAASGNTLGLSVDYPAKYENVISVSAIKENLKRSGVSAKGKIDYAAPGINILTTDNKGDYSYYSGTSFATAYVTGTVAVLLAQKDLIFNSRNIKSYLNDKTKDLGEKGYDSEYGSGLIMID